MVNFLPEKNKILYSDILTALQQKCILERDLMLSLDMHTQYALQCDKDT